MEFNYTPQQLMFREVVRDFAKREVEPIAAEIDENSRFPWETVKKMAKMGLFGITVSREFGGAGCDYITYMIAVEEISKVCASTCGIIAAVNSLACWPIDYYGTEEQKKKYLIPMSHGEKLGAFGLTEPEAGSDAFAQRTIAEDKGDHYLLNGNKIFISGGDVADTHIIFAKLVTRRGKRGRMCAFIVEKAFDGFSVGVKEKKMGIRASGTAELVMQDVKVPKENLLGRVGQGFEIAMATLDGGRIGIAAQALGIAQGSLDVAIKYSKERKQFGHAIARLQAIQWMIADIATDVEAARLLTYKAAYLKNEGKPFGTEAAMAKLYASEACERAATKALQIHGGYGYMKDYPVERYFRDSKITQIYEGTSEIQRLVIATNILKG
ncbi:MAG: acyl-CoA dehydrogenase [Candidatus Muiribacterium halophilum]|uniref:Acyl-CoA dehydrogenase n=1 Tax=Muiribacterium halophilum TaxID=2053465 RepID=A0A2N5ZGT8_MUIH1|nr:MAG: acyl-CoA dehydrogenase [Candidatus Muirbacterium halophilum]